MKIIKEELEAATALLTPGEFEHEISNDNAAIIVSENEEPRATKRPSINSLHGPQKKQCCASFDSKFEHGLIHFNK